MSNDKTMLTKQVADLKQKSKDSDYIIRGKLQEKDDQILNLTEQFSSMQSMMEKLVSCLSKTTDQQQLNTLSQLMFSSGILKEMTTEAKK